MVELRDHGWATGYVSAAPLLLYGPGKRSRSDLSCAVLGTNREHHCSRSARYRNARENEQRGDAEQRRSGLALYGGWSRTGGRTRGLSLASGRRLSHTAAISCDYGADARMERAPAASRRPRPNRT